VAVEQQLHLVQVLHNLVLVEQVQWIGVRLQRQHHLQVLAVMVTLLIQHCGAVTVTLPATPSAGDIISVADYASTFQTNNLTLCRNSSKINGVCGNSILNTEGQSITLVYVDGTRGWKNTMDSTSDVSGAPNYIVATGGTITCCGDYKIHTFTADGCFAVSKVALCAPNNVVSYMVVAGGGGGGGSIACTNGGAGGGAGGGFREYKNSCDPYTASPLNGNPGGTSVTVTATTYPISVGAGGAGGTACAGSNGANSIFSTITSAGGGKGGGRSCTPTSGDGGNGGSGGGAGYGTVAAGTAGTGNTPPTSPPQGNNGTPFSGGTPNIAKGGGSAGGTPTTQNGSDGVASSITGSSVYRSGAGGASHPAGSTGGNGGGGAGSFPGPTATPGIANTGGGGGGSAADSNPNPTTGGAGGSGIVVIRYKFQ
jgi:hypothetical protein